MRPNVRSLMILLASPVLATGAFAATPLHSTSVANPAAATSGQMTVVVPVANGQNTVGGTLGANNVVVSKFDTSTGILVGATVAVSTAASATVQVGGNVQNSGPPAIEGTAQLTGVILAPGVQFQGSSLTANKSCFYLGCSPNPANQQASTTGSIVGSSAVPTANLADYAGNDVVVFTRSAFGSTTVRTSPAATLGIANAFFTFGGAVASNNVYNITYDFLHFADPSFGSSTGLTDKTLHFGTMYQDAGPVTLNFTLFNVGDLNSAGLSLASITRQSGDSGFTTTLSTFTNGLDGGNLLNYSVTFTPDMLGLSSDVFTLGFGDYAPGGIGARLHQLTLTARANVIMEPTGVPEPETWAMMVIGFGLIGMARRTRLRRALPSLNEAGPPF